MTREQGSKDDQAPTPQELERELNDYLNKKYGKQFKLGVTSTIPPQPASDRINEDEEEKKTAKTPAINFDIKPEDLEAYLDHYVIRQNKAKGILATKICTHFNRIKLLEKSKRYADHNHVGSVKNNIIMIGPTGVGKTYLIKLIAKKIGVPFVKGDATKFSETGYVGGDVEDLVRDLVHESNGDIERAQYGIVYLDEIDKIASSQSLVGPDVSRTGVQRALLKPMEETDVELKVPHDLISQMEALEHYRKTGKKEKQKVNTRNILFIMSGAFNGLEDIIRKRLNRQNIGFGAQIQSRSTEESLLPQVKAEDLIAYGFESEFIGRLPVVAVFETLDSSDLCAILKNSNDPIILGKKRDFRAYGIDIKFEDEALEKIAEHAFQEKTGARGLVSSMEKVLLSFEKKLPSTAIKRLVVTPQMVDGPEQALEKVLCGESAEAQEKVYQELTILETQRLKESIYRRKQEFLAQYGLLLDEEIINLITSWVMEEGISVSGAYEEAVKIRQKVKDYEHYFFSAHGLEITFANDAVNGIIQSTIQDNASPWELCKSTLRNYEFGLKLIKEKTGKTKFTISREALLDPEGYLNRLILNSYE